MDQWGIGGTLYIDHTCIAYNPDWEKQLLRQRYQWWDNSIPEALQESNQKEYHC